jgi:hypothetical protein
MLDLLRLKEFFLVFGSLFVMLLSLVLYVGLRLLVNAGSKITLRTLIARLSLKPVIILQFFCLIILVFFFINALYETLVKDLILQIEGIVILLNIIFLTERRGGKRLAIFKNTLVQLALISIFQFIIHKLCIAFGFDFTAFTIENFRDIMLSQPIDKTFGKDYQTVFLIHILIISLLWLMGFSPFVFNAAFLFKKKNVSEKILYISIFCNIIICTIIKLFTGFNELKYLAIIYLFANAFSLIIARKIDEIIFNFINFGLSIALLLLSIENISTNYASLITILSLLFSIFCSISYHNIYKDVGFVGKPRSISAKIASLGLANKHKIQAVFICLLGVSLMSTPVSLAMFPYMFLQIFNHSRLINYIIILVCFFTISFALVRLYAPFATCIKYARPIFRLDYPSDAIYQKSYKLSNFFLIIICLTVFIAALIINFNRSNIYKEFYLFDTGVMFLFTFVCAILLYGSRYYIYLLSLTQITRGKTNLFLLKIYTLVFKIVNNLYAKHITMYSRLVTKGKKIMYFALQRESYFTEASVTSSIFFSFLLSIFTILILLQ